MPPKKGSGRVQFHGGYVLPSTRRAIDAYLERTGSKVGHLSDAMWIAYCVMHNLDEKTGLPREKE